MRTDGGAALSLRDTEDAYVALIRKGPPRTLAFAYWNGVVGLWSLRTGARLLDVQLRGLPTNLLLKDRKLYVTTEAGDHEVLDLGVFYKEHCELLRELWKQVPGVWVGDRIVRRPPSKAHECLEAEAEGHEQPAPQ